MTQLGIIGATITHVHLPTAFDVGIRRFGYLHDADVGISVDSAVDVAKDSADLIMLKHDLTMLSDAVAEGRRTFANIRKYIMMATSSDFGNMVSMAVAAVFLPFLPILPTQILLNNILYDLSETVLPLDHVDAQDTDSPQHWDVDSAPGAIHFGAVRIHHYGWRRSS